MQWDSCRHVLFMENPGCTGQGAGFGGQKAEHVMDDGFGEVEEERTLDMRSRRRRVCMKKQRPDGLGVPGLPTTCCRRKSVPWIASELIGKANKRTLDCV